MKECFPRDGQNAQITQTGELDTCWGGEPCKREASVQLYMQHHVSLTLTKIMLSQIPSLGPDQSMLEAMGKKVIGVELFMSVEAQLEKVKRKGI